MKKMMISAATLLALSVPAVAQTATAPAAAPAAVPAAAAPGAVTLSAILQKLEAEPGFVRFDEVDFDRDGYWEIEYLSGPNASTTVKIDATTGQPRAN